MKAIETWLLIAVGGAAGSCLRHGIGTRIAARAGTGFPWGTLLVNIVGSLLLGLLLGRAWGAAADDARLRALLAVGFCGGFTTFSSFSWETIKLFEVRGAAWAASYIAASVGLSLLGTLGGAMIARELA